MPVLLHGNFLCLKWNKICLRYFCPFYQVMCVGGYPVRYQQKWPLKSGLRLKVLTSLQDYCWWLWWWQRAWSAPKEELGRSYTLARTWSGKYSQILSKPHFYSALISGRALILRAIPSALLFLSWHLDLNQGVAKKHPKPPEVEQIR